MLGFTYYSQFGLGMQFSFLSVPFLVGCVFIGVPILKILEFICSPDHSSMPISLKAHDDFGGAQSLVKSYVVLSFLVLSCVAFEYFSVLQFGSSLLGSFNIAMILTIGLAAMLIITRLQYADNVLQKSKCLDSQRSYGGHGAAKATLYHKIIAGWQSPEVYFRQQNEYELVLNDANKGLTTFTC